MKIKSFLSIAVTLYLVTGCTNQNTEILSNRPTTQPSSTLQPHLQRIANYIRTVPDEGVQNFSADILETTDTLVVIKFTYPGLNLSRTLRFDIKKQIITDIAEEGNRVYEPQIIKANLRLSKKENGKIHLEGDAVWDDHITQNLWVIDEIEPKVIEEEKMDGEEAD